MSKTFPAAGADGGQPGRHAAAVGLGNGAEGLPFCLEDNRDADTKACYDDVHLLGSVAGGIASEEPGSRGKR